MKPTMTLIVPYYRNCAMLARQIKEWEQYNDKVRILLVDDGSLEEAAPIVMQQASDDLRARLRVYRITVDIPWNREGARNLGAHECDTDWLIHLDIDHILPASSVRDLLRHQLNPKQWYRFARWRMGRADETRKKDLIAPGEQFGQIKPHIDSYLMTRSLYWRVGGYDEDYAGVLGGGTAFLQRVEAITPASLLPNNIALHVYTRDKIKDASDWTLSRDTAPGKEITKRKQAAGDTTPKNPLRFPWVRVL